MGRFRFSNRRFSPTPFQRTPQMKIALSIGMLLVLGMIIIQARDPGVWRWIVAKEVNNTDPNPADKKPEVVFAEYPIQSGPIDTDPEEWKQAEPFFEMVKDNQTLDDQLNSAAKLRLLRWVMRQKPEEFFKRKTIDLSYNQLINNPKRYRGQLVRFRVRIKRCLPLESDAKELAGLHEMIGFNERTGYWLYWLVTPGLPPGFPTGDIIDSETVDVVGYVHTSRRFMSAEGKVSLAPEIVGIATWYPSRPAPPSNEPWYALLLALVVLPLLGIAIWVRFRNIGKPTDTPPPQRVGDVSDWLASPESQIGENEIASNSPPAVDDDRFEPYSQR